MKTLLGVVIAIVGIWLLGGSESYASYCTTDCWTDTSGDTHCSTRCF